jgi:hypothetical protein
MRARSALAVLMALAAAGCVEEGPADPTPPPPVAGTYVLAVEASSVCRLPVGRFQWQVEATSTGTPSVTGDVMSTRVTLTAGDNTVDLSLTTSILSTVAGTLVAREAEFGDEALRLVFTGAVRGTVSAGSAGRSAVTDGTYNGTIALAPPDNEDEDAVVSCTAANHRWTLAPE